MSQNAGARPKILRDAIIAVISGTLILYNNIRTRGFCNLDNCDHRSTL